MYTNRNINLALCNNYVSIIPGCGVFKVLQVTFHTFRGDAYKVAGAGRMISHDLHLQGERKVGQWALLLGLLVDGAKVVCFVITVVA